MTDAIPAGIAAELAAGKGRITFARFMDLALTQQDEGYYARADRVLGPRGDFSTAPTLSPSFNRAVAALVTELFDAAVSAVCDSGAGDPGVAGFPAVARTAIDGTAFNEATGDGRPFALVELGAGEGHLARAVLGAWQAGRTELMGHVGYCIVELGRRLRARQEDALGELMTAGWRVQWGADLEEACRGFRPVVILGNEFIDALPVHLVDLRGEQIGEIWVSSNGGLVEEWGELSAAAARELAFLLGGEDSSEFPDEYDSEDLASLRALTVDGIIELRPAVAGLMSDIAAVMPAGSLVSIDYGEWYGEGREAEEESAGSQPPAAPGAAAPPRRSLDPSRTTRSPLLRGRTVRGYFRHQMTRDPLTRIGRQDLTADVDFSALDRHGSAAGFETVVFTNLARLLAGGGGAQELAVLRGPCGAAHPDVLEMERQEGVLAALLDEEDLGGSFKVMIQVRE